MKEAISLVNRMILRTSRIIRCCEGKNNYINGQAKNGKRGKVLFNHAKNFNSNANLTNLLHFGSQSLPKQKQDIIYDMWLKSDEGVKQGHKLTVVDDDIFVNWCFVM